MEDPIQKITKTKKRARVVAQVVECLSSKFKALSSNLSTIRKKKLYIFNITGMLIFAGTLRLT
jgi:hypothetical protein